MTKNSFEKRVNKNAEFIDSFLKISVDTDCSSNPNNGIFFRILK